MTSNVVDIGPCSKKVSVSIEATAVQAEVDRNYNELRNTITLPGFRRGKAPRSLLEKRFASHVIEDVKRDVVVKGIDAAVKEHKLEIVAYPDVEFEKISIELGKGLEFDFAVEVKPDFTLPSLAGLEVKRPAAVVTDQDIDQVINRICERMSDLRPVEGEGATEKDYVFGALTVTSGGKVEVERDQTHAAAGIDDAIDGFPLDDKSRLLGLKADSVLEWSTTVPSDHKIAALRGKSVEAKFAVNEVKRVHKAAVEDIIGHYDCDTPEALRERIKGQLLNEKKQASEVVVEEKLIDLVLERCPFPVPQTVVQKTVNAHVEERLKEAYMTALYAGEKLADEKFHEMAAAMRTEELPKAERSIRAWYLIERIAKKEKIFATEADLEQKIEDMAVAEGKTPTQIREILVKEDSLDGLRMRILEQKVRNFLKAEARIVDEGV